MPGEASASGVKPLEKLKTTFVSGAMAGMVSRTATAPLDRLKTLAQAGCSRPATSSPNLAGAVRLMYREGGMLALYQGNSANVLKSMPEVGVKFVAFEWVSASRQGSSSRVADRLFSGAVAGVASCVAIYPLEVAKTRMALAPLGVYVSSRSRNS